MIFENEAISELKKISQIQHMSDSGLVKTEEMTEAFSQSHYFPTATLHTDGTSTPM